MIRNLKALGLALVAVFALSAVAASAASAQQGKLTSDGSVTLDVAERAGELNALTAFGGETTCVGSTLTGHKTVTTKETEHLEETKIEFKHELIPVPATAVTVTPDYNQATCKVVEGGKTHKATVTMNKCDYDFSVGATKSVGVYNVTADVVCPKNGDIQVDVYAFANSELGGVACTVTVKEQVGLAGPVLINTKFKETVGGKEVETEDLDINGTFTGITVSKSGFGCATAEEAKGEFHLNVTVTGTAEGGKATDITVTDTP